MVLEEIKEDLANNFILGDENILQNFIDEATTNALSISNRINNEINIELLKSEIKQYVKTKYLQRGTEDTNSLNESGRNSNFKNAYDELRENIIKNGKRVLF